MACTSLSREAWRPDGHLSPPEHVTHHPQLSSALKGLLSPLSRYPPSATAPTPRLTPGVKKTSLCHPITAQLALVSRWPVQEPARALPRIAQLGWQSQAWASGFPSQNLGPGRQSRWQEEKRPADTCWAITTYCPSLPPLPPSLSPSLHQAMFHFWEVPALGLNWIQVSAICCLWLRGVGVTLPRNSHLVEKPVAQTLWGGSLCKPSDLTLL